MGPRTLGRLLALCLSAAAFAPAVALELEPCRLTDAAGNRGVDAECGTFRVPEDRSAPDGTAIDLFVARIPALAPVAREDALTLVQGGPGGSSVDLYLTLRDAFEPVRRVRDIILVDQRGTGRSNPMTCPEPEDVDPLEAMNADPELSRQYARDCLAGLTGDPRFYTTSVAVADLEAVREALGYPTLNIYGVSYGSRVGLHFLRRHPDRVRTLTIDGVAPTDWALGPDVARFGQDALDRIFARCAADAGCTAAFGDIAGRFATLQAALREAPVEVQLRHPTTGAPITRVFSELQLVLATRLLAYQTESAALLPLLIHQAASGDVAPFAAQAELVTTQMAETLALGMHNAVVCTEDAPFVTDLDGLEATYMGRQTTDALLAMCSVWPAGEMDDGFREPVTSAAPVLLLSGEADPVTPPANAERAARTLGNSRHLVVPGHGHGVVMRGCVPLVLDRFITAGHLDDLQAGCIERERPMPFFIDFTGPTP